MYEQPKSWKDWVTLLSGWLSLFTLGLEAVFNVDITPLQEQWLLLLQEWQQYLQLRFLCKVIHPYRLEYLNLNILRNTLRAT
jgi:hypothetical protein